MSRLYAHTYIHVLTWIHICVYTMYYTSIVVYIYIFWSYCNHRKTPMIALCHVYTHTHISTCLHEFIYVYILWFIHQLSYISIYSDHIEIIARHLWLHYVTFVRTHIYTHTHMNSYMYVDNISYTNCRIYLYTLSIFWSSQVTVCICEREIVRERGDDARWWEWHNQCNHHVICWSSQVP